jgi:tripartite-type tricarboxylate transporter receptor subunit TctC
MTRDSRRALSRRGFTFAAAGALSMPAIGRLSAQGTFPAGQQIKIVVPYPAGGATDIVGRIMADALSAIWKTTVVVENVAGAGANVGMDRVAKGPSDGTQLLIVPPNMATNQFLYPKLQFDPDKDFVPLSQVARLANLLCVKKALPVASVPELITHLKANPGKLNYASSGIGTTLHLSAELFKRMVGVDMVHVAYRGSAPALNDLVGGQVDVMFDNVPSILPQATAGNVKGLAVTSRDRWPAAKAYPTVNETVPGFEVTSWFGLAVRAGTPAELVAKLETDIRAAAQDAAAKERLVKGGFEPLATSAAEFNGFILDERKRWGTLITEAKIKAE